MTSQYLTLVPYILGPSEGPRGYPVVVIDALPWEEAAGVHSG